MKCNYRVCIWIILNVCKLSISRQEALYWLVGCQASGVWFSPVNNVLTPAAARCSGLKPQPNVIISSSSSQRHGVHTDLQPRAHLSHWPAATCTPLTGLLKGGLDFSVKDVSMLPSVKWASLSSDTRRWRRPQTSTSSTWLWLTLCSSLRYRFRYPPPSQMFYRDSVLWALSLLRSDWLMWLNRYRNTAPPSVSEHVSHKHLWILRAVHLIRSLRTDVNQRHVRTWMNILYFS